MENYKCGSAEGVSLSFLTVWLLGDVTNFFGAIWAGLVPTVIVLAVYFCVLDTILISQCLYYNYINARSARRKQSMTAQDGAVDDPEQPLLGRHHSPPLGRTGSRRGSSLSQRRRRSSQISNTLQGGTLSHLVELDGNKRVWVKNATSILLVCAAGAAGWLVAWKTGVWTPTPDEDAGGTSGMEKGPQILGYLSALCYLG